MWTNYFTKSIELSNKLTQVHLVWTQFTSATGLGRYVVPDIPVLRKERTGVDHCPPILGLIVDSRDP